MAKTVKVETIKRQANFYLMNSGDQFKAERRAIQGFVDSLLMDANAYKGFTYLTAERSVPGHSIGLAYDIAAHKNIFPDDTRIQFI